MVIARSSARQVMHTRQCLALRVVPPFPTLAPVAQESLEILIPIQLRMPSLFHLGIEYSRLG